MPWVKRKFALLSALFVLVGCGTLARTNQVISVDSLPQNLVVSRQETFSLLDLATGSKPSAAEIPGSTLTPTFINIKRGLSHRLVLTDGTGESQSYTFYCGLSWAESLVPNGIVIGLGVLFPPLYVVGAGGMAIDGFSGGLFHCKDRLQLRAVNAQEFVRPVDCHTYLLMAPYDLDPLRSEKIAQRWLEVARQRLPSCSRVVYDDELREQFAYANLDHTSDISPAQLRASQLNHMGYYFRADRVVRLRQARNDDKTQIFPEIYDLHNVAQVEEKRDLSFDMPAEDSTTTRYQIVAWGLDLVPNSIIVSPSHQNDSLTTTDPDATSKDRQNPSLNAVTALSLTRILHPSGFRPWDVTLELYSSATGSYADRRSIYDEKSKEQRTQMVQFFPTINYGPTFFTPAGALGLYLTGGPGYVFVLEDGVYDSKRHEVVLARGVSFWYSAFITKNVFFSLSVQALSLNRSVVNNDVHRSYSIFSASSGIGYFFPTVRSHTVSLLEKFVY